MAITGENSDVSLVVTALVLAVTFEPLKLRLQAYAERFRELPAPRPASPPLPDDAWIEAVAVRAAQIIRADGATGASARERPALPPNVPAER